MKQLTEESMAALRRQAKDSDQTMDRFWHYIYADLVIAEFCRINGLTAESAEQREHGQAPGNSILSRVEELHNKAFMPWREAEHLALSEAGIGNSKIDELIGECSSSPVVTLLDDEEVREFVRSILVHSGSLYTTPPTPPAGVPDGYAAVDAQLLREIVLDIRQHIDQGVASEALEASRRPGYGTGIYTHIKHKMDAISAMLSAAPQPAAQTQKREAGT